MTESQEKMPERAALAVFVDADACPARDEILFICKRHSVIPTFVANNEILSITNSMDAKMKVVPGDFDGADNWLIEQANEGDLILTADLLLAQRAVKKKIEVMNFSGNVWTDDVIHDLVARREVQKYLREMSLPSHQPVAYSKENRSRLKAALHQWLESRLRARRGS
jgi:uncharacterized protein YaiI (UPF0178 family)